MRRIHVRTRIVGNIPYSDSIYGFSACVQWVPSIRIYTSKHMYDRQNLTFRRRQVEIPHKTWQCRIASIGIHNCEGFTVWMSSYDAKCLGSNDTSVRSGRKRTDTCNGCCIPEPNPWMIRTWNLSTVRDCKHIHNIGIAIFYNFLFAFVYVILMLDRCK